MGRRGKDICSPGGRGVHWRAGGGGFTERVGGAVVSEDFFGEDFDFVCGDWGVGVFGARYGRGQELGSVDEEVRGEESARGERFEFASGGAGVSIRGPRRS